MDTKSGEDNSEQSEAAGEAPRKPIESMIYTVWKGADAELTDVGIFAILVILVLVVVAIMTGCQTVPPHLCGTGFIINSEINCGHEKDAEHDAPHIVVSPTFTLPEHPIKH